MLDGLKVEKDIVTNSMILSQTGQILIVLAIALGFTFGSSKCRRIVSFLLHFLLPQFYPAFTSLGTVTLS